MNLFLSNYHTVSGCESKDILNFYIHIYKKDFTADFVDKLETNALITHIMYITQYCKYFNLNTEYRSSQSIKLDL